MAVTHLIDPDFKKQRSEEFIFYLFGEHISKSKAPLLHNLCFKYLNLNWQYKLFESSDCAGFKEKFDAEKLIGSAITMPNKVNAIDTVVDELDDIGRGCGAINTVYVRIDSRTGDPRKIGTNTDTIGIKDGFLQNYPEETRRYAGHPGLVYGGGGACRSAIYTLHSMLDVSKLYIINRFEHEIQEAIRAMRANGFDGEIIPVTSPEQAKQLEAPKLVVLTVPNFKPVTPEELQAKATLDVFMKQDKPGVVLEMCYHPIIETLLYNEFKEKNWKVISGVEAMIYQGFAQQIFWTGLPLEKLPTKQVIEALYDTIKRESS